MEQSAQQLLRQMVLGRAKDNANWLTEQFDLLRSGASDRNFHIFFGLIPRRLGKADLEPTAAEQATAEAACAGWHIDDWTVDGAARVLALLLHRSDRAFVDRFRDLRRTADITELIAIFRGLPLYGEPETLVGEACEGVRSNMKAVFEAVAHNNPYPRDHFSQAQWNQMVLKSLFIESTMRPIIGLDQRANAELAGILRDYAHERWAAGRRVNPWLWRCVGPFATDDSAIADLERAREAGPHDAQAAALAMAASSAAADRFNQLPEAESIRAGALDWNNVEENAS